MSGHEVLNQLFWVVVLCLFRKERLSCMPRDCRSCMLSFMSLFSLLMKMSWVVSEVTEWWRDLFSFVSVVTLIRGFHRVAEILYGVLQQESCVHRVREVYCELKSKWKSCRHLLLLGVEVKLSLSRSISVAFIVQSRCMHVVYFNICTLFMFRGHFTNPQKDLT